MTHYIRGLSPCEHKNDPTLSPTLDLVDRLRTLAIQRTRAAHLSGAGADDRARVAGAGPPTGVEWQTLGGAALFALALAGAACGCAGGLPRPTRGAANRGHAGGPGPAHDVTAGTGARTAPGPVGPDRPGGDGAVWLLPSTSWLRRYRYTWVGLALALQVLTLAFGDDPNGSGAALWFLLGPVSIQPTETVKLLLVLFLAAYLDDYRELLALTGRRVGPLRLPPLPYLAPILVMAGAALMLFGVQRDLGPALLFSSVLLAMLYVASGRASYVWLGCSCCWPAERGQPTVRPRRDARGDLARPVGYRDSHGYQLVQALYASARAACSARARVGHASYIPAVHTDFVIAAIGEELGLVGTLAVVNLFVLFVVRGFGIALRARSGFELLLAAGLTAVVGLQALIILAGALKSFR